MGYMADGSFTSHKNRFPEAAVARYGSKWRQFCDMSLPAAALSWSLVTGHHVILARIDVLLASIHALLAFPISQVVFPIFRAFASSSA